VSLALARTLVLTDVVPWSQVAQALFVSATKDVPFVKALLDSAAISLDRLEEVLSRADVPPADRLQPNAELLERLPRGLCARFLAIPLRRGESGTVDVAFVDARDEHAVREIAHHLQAKVRILRAPYSKVFDAVSRLPTPRREDQQQAFMESTLVSIRAPEGIQLPPSENRVPAAPPPAAGTPAQAQPTLAPTSTGSSPPLPLVRRASEQQPIPLVRRAEAEPVIELRSPYSRTGRAYIESASMAALRTASDRNQILRLLLDGASEYAKRVIIFAVRRDCFGALMATPSVAEENRIKELRVPLAGPSIFATVASGGSIQSTGTSRCWP